MNPLSLKREPAVGQPFLYQLVGLELVFAALLGFGLNVLGADGGAWIVGGILAGGLLFHVYRTRYNPQAKPNKRARKIGQVLVGLTVGFSVQLGDLWAIAPQLPIFLGLTLFLLIGCSAIGLLYARLTKTDLMTATLATTPGNIGVMATIAADYGGNTPLVSIIQLMRFTAVTFVIPVIANVSNPHGVALTLHYVTRGLFELDGDRLLRLGVVLGMAALAVRLGEKLQVPVAALICSILVGLVFHSSLALLPVAPQVDFSLPPLLSLLGQILLGLTIGEYWAVNPRLQGTMVVSTAIPVALTFLTGFLSAGIAMLVTPWDWLTCMLVTAPGGSPEMIWIALSLNHDVEIVTAGHLIRLLAINCSIPLLVSLASAAEQFFKRQREAGAIAEVPLPQKVLERSL